jgi:hypothetical protein
MVKRLLLVGALLGTAAVLTAGPSLRAQKKQPKFVPPEVESAGDINYPIDSVASGVVVVAVKLGDEGQIEGTEVLRDVPSLTAPVLLSLQNWTFKPATLDAKAVDSTIVVSVAFNPSDYRLRGGTTSAFGKELRTLSPDDNGFLPPKITGTAWAEYPMNSLAQGAVLLDVSISDTGEVTRAVPVATVASLTALSVNAAKKWTFQAARFKGMAIPSKAVVGFVFRLPNISQP